MMYWPFGPAWSWCTGPWGQFHTDVLALGASLVMMCWPFGRVWSWCTGPTGQFSHDVLAVPASLVLMYWPLGPVLYWCTGPSGQFGHDVLALRASLVMMYWPFGPVWAWCIGPSGQFDPATSNRNSKSKIETRNQKWKSKLELKTWYCREPTNPNCHHKNTVCITKPDFSWVGDLSQFLAIFQKFCPLVPDNHTQCTVCLVINYNQCKKYWAVKMKTQFLLNNFRECVENMTPFKYTYLGSNYKM